MADNNDFIDRLREDPMYQAALAKARTPAERQLITTLVENLVGGIGGVLGPVIERAKRDPEFARQLNKAISEDKDVLTASTAALSGSTS